MINDTNRLVYGDTNSQGSGANIIGTGSDGNVYWSLFNIEGENAITATYVTYATLADMLTDSNRLVYGFPNTQGSGPNIIGTGAWVMPDDPTDPEPSPVPVPASLPLLFGAIAATGLMRRRRPGAAAELSRR